MIYSNTLSTFIIHHDLNGLCNKNLRLIQDIMRTSEPAGDKFKHKCGNFPNLAILTKSATPGDVQLTFVHASVGNKYLRESITAFALARLLEAPTVVSIDVEIAFAIAGDNIWIPVTEVLLRVAAVDLSRLKKNRDWVALNAVLLPPLLTEATILDSKTSQQTS